MIKTIRDSVIQYIGRCIEAKAYWEYVEEAMRDILGVDIQKPSPNILEINVRGKPWGIFKVPGKREYWNLLKQVYNDTSKREPDCPSTGGSVSGNLC